VPEMNGAQADPDPEVGKAETVRHVVRPSSG
jgi:hypothetical protein